MQNLIAALAKARVQFENPERNKSVSIQTKSGPGYAYMYASLDEILDSVTVPLSNNGLAITTTVEPKDGILFAVVALRHESGELLVSEYPMPEGLPAKDFGGVLKTVRRHLICALLNISPIESDDGPGSQAKSAPLRKHPAYENGGSNEVTKPMTVRRVNDAKARYRLTTDDVRRILADNQLPDVYELNVEQCDRLINLIELDASMRVGV